MIGLKLLPGKAMKEVVRTAQIGVDKHGDILPHNKYGYRKWREKAEKHLKKYDLAKRSKLADAQYDREDGQHHIAAAIVDLLQILELELGKQ